MRINTSAAALRICIISTSAYLLQICGCVLSLNSLNEPIMFERLSYCEFLKWLNSKRCWTGCLYLSHLPECYHLLWRMRCSLLSVPFFSQASLRVESTIRVNGAMCSLCWCSLLSWIVFTSEWTRREYIFALRREINLPTICFDIDKRNGFGI